MLAYHVLLMPCTNTAQGHNGAICDVSWSQHAVGTIATCATDNAVHIWYNTTKTAQESLAPSTRYELPNAVTAVQWCPTKHNWLSIAHGSKCLLLKQDSNIDSILS